MNAAERRKQREWEAKRKALIVAHILAGRRNCDIRGMNLNPPATAEEINRLRIELKEDA